MDANQTFFHSEQHADPKLTLHPILLESNLWTRVEELNIIAKQG